MSTAWDALTICNVREFQYYVTGCTCMILTSTHFGELMEFTVGCHGSCRSLPCVLLLFKITEDEDW